MDDIAEVIVIGAGLAGVSCARRLVAAGRSVMMLDKGRGIGGRMATRRVTLEAGTIRFDHGAQYLRAEDPDFTQALQTGPVQGWLDNARLVGVPGMSSLPRALADGLQVRQGVEVTHLSHAQGRWHLTTTAGSMQTPRLVLTIPAPQARSLLGAADPLAAKIANVEMSPCLTLMAAFPPGSARPFPERLDHEHPLAWIAQDSSKPGRGDAAVTWVAQAGPDYSAAHLEATREEIAAQMRPLLCDAIGEDPARALYAQAHRWRYAQTARPLGQTCLHDRGRALSVGGDWCLGPRAEHAWQSGRAIAAHILAHADAR